MFSGVHDAERAEALVTLVADRGRAAGQQGERHRDAGEHADTCLPDIIHDNVHSLCGHAAPDVL